MLQHALDLNKKKKTLNILEIGLIKVKAENVDTELRLKQIAEEANKLKEEILKVSNKNEVLEFDNKIIKYLINNYYYTKIYK